VLLVQKLAVLCYAGASGCLLRDGGLRPIVGKYPIIWIALTLVIPHRLMGMVMEFGFGKVVIVIGGGLTALEIWIDSGRCN